VCRWVTNRTDPSCGVVREQIAMSIFDWCTRSTATEPTLTIQLLHFSCTHTHTYIHIHEGVEQSVSIGSNCSINHRLQKTAQDFVGHWVSMVLYTTMTSCLWLCRLSKMSLIPSKLQNHDIMFLTNLVQQHTPCRTLRSASAKLLSLTHCNLSFHARARGLNLADAAIWNSE